MKKAEKAGMKKEVETKKKAEMMKKPEMKKKAENLLTDIHSECIL